MGRNYAVGGRLARERAGSRYEGHLRGLPNAFTERDTMRQSDDRLNSGRSGASRVPLSRRRFLTLAAAGVPALVAARTLGAAAQAGATPARIIVQARTAIPTANLVRSNSEKRLNMAG